MPIPFNSLFTCIAQTRRVRFLPLGKVSAWCIAFSVVGFTACAAEPLHVKIDALLAEAHPAGQAPIANDADFFRRTHLALHGVIPTAAQARAFFADTAPDKRARLVDALLADPQFAKWMAVRFDVMLMERRAETQTKALPWREWLEQSFAANKPWDALVREIVTADGVDEKSRHLARWLVERDADPNALAKDAARLFLGRDITCSQCHDHPRIDDYLQRDYAGIQAFFGRTSVFRPDGKKSAGLAEQAAGETTYLSVFTKVGGTTKPRLPGEAELAEPAPGEWTVPPNSKDKSVRPIPKYSRRAALAATLGDGHHPAFRRNIANRLWAVVFGRGLVEPLDLHHSGNPPSNPALLDLLGEQIAAMKFDMRAFIREIALTQAFQRALDLPELPPEAAKLAAEKLAVLEKEAAALGTSATSAEDEFGKVQKAIVEAQRAAAPSKDEQAKQDAEVAKAQKAFEAAAADQKKSEALAATKRTAQTTLNEAAAKLVQPADEAGQPPKPNPAAKALQTKIATNEKELLAAETDAAAKKAAADAKAQSVASARRNAAAAKAKADDLTKQIAAKQTALDAVGARKETARIKAKYGGQLAAELKAALNWRDASVAASAGTASLDPAKAGDALAAAWGRSFAAMELLPLAPEQLCWSAMQATGQLETLRTAATGEWDAKNKLSDADLADPAKKAARAEAIERLFRDKLRGSEDQFVRFFGGAAGQPQTDFYATPEQALYFENGGVVRQWATNLANRAAALADPMAMAEEVYLSVLTRLPDGAEVAELSAAIAGRPPEKKSQVLGDVAWALLTSTEFRFSH